MDLSSEPPTAWQSRARRRGLVELAPTSVAEYRLSTALLRDRHVALPPKGNTLQSRFLRARDQVPGLNRPSARGLGNRCSIH